MFASTICPMMKYCRRCKFREASAIERVPFETQGCLTARLNNPSCISCFSKRYKIVSRCARAFRMFRLAEWMQVETYYFRRVASEIRRCAIQRVHVLHTRINGDASRNFVAKRCASLPRESLADCYLRSPLRYTYTADTHGI